MCGFSGFLSITSAIADPIGVLDSMGRAIDHRGPNDAGVWFDVAGKIGLSHRRLAIVDLSAAGSQPMHSVQGRYALAFNGEIYNHLALRAKLKNEGKIFFWRGHSDTETLLACIETWGLEETLKASVGMFAIALWDKDLSRLSLARDRFGEKPLYWGRQGGDVIFGSELKALRKFPGFSGEVCRNALAYLLKYNYIPSPHCIYKNFYKIQPGTIMTVEANGEVSGHSTYWSVTNACQIGQHEGFQGGDYEAVDALESCLTKSISDQMLADVPLGAFLSGGVDSSAVVALMQKQSMRPVKTFTIGFNDKGFDEAIHAKEVAKHLGTEHTELYIEASSALAVIPKLASMYCEPFADSSQIPTFLVSEMARKHVTVALSGDGGDELFGGYNAYQFAPRLWTTLSSLPLSVRKILPNLIPQSLFGSKINKLLSLSGSESREQFYDLLMSHWVKPELLIKNADNSPSLFSQSSIWPITENFESWMMAMDAQTYMSDDILVKVDRAAMANSLETRVPLLDHRVAELAWRLPLDMKIRDGKGKWVLREVLYRHVPKSLIERPKKGFSIPLGEWLRGPLREWAHSLLDERLLEQQGYFYPKPIKKLWAQHLAGKADRSRQLWSILMFQAWLQEQA